MITIKEAKAVNFVSATSASDWQESYFFCALPLERSTTACCFHVNITRTHLQRTFASHSLQFYAKRGKENAHIQRQLCMMASHRLLHDRRSCCHGYCLTSCTAHIHSLLVPEVHVPKPASTYVWPYHNSKGPRDSFFFLNFSWSLSANGTGWGAITWLEWWPLGQFISLPLPHPSAPITAGQEFARPHNSLVCLLVCHFHQVVRNSNNSMISLPGCYTRVQ